MTSESAPCGSSVAHGMKRFSGKVAVITGSTAGIGLAIAQRLGLEGCAGAASLRFQERLRAVVVSSRKEQAVSATVANLRRQGIECVGTVCHVGSAEHRQALVDLAVKSYGKIDALISNAVVNPTAGPLLETPDAAIDKILDVNIKAAILLTKTAVPHMPAGGSVLFVTSIVAYSPSAPLSMYGISKTALLGVTKALAAELGGSGIRVNGIAPGIVPTKFSEALVETDELRDMQVSRTLLGRLGKPEDIAGAAAFLTSDDAGYVTGETLVVAGGMQSKL